VRDGPIRRAAKAVALLRFRIDLALTRLVRRLRGEPRFALVGECVACGRCCDTPMVQTHYLLFRTRFVRAAFLWWHRVVNGFEYLGEDRATSTYRFRCTHLDPQTRRCDSYRSRPGMCRDYPRAQLFTADPAFFDECGYRPVLRGAEGFRASLDRLDLPPEQVAELRRKLHLDE